MTQTPPAHFLLNGKPIEANCNETLLQVAKRQGIKIPHLCYKKGYRPDGNCRSCMVEIKGERVLAPSCCRYPSEGMEVVTDSARALGAQHMVLELLLADMPGQGKSPHSKNSKLDSWAARLNVGKPRFGERPQPALDVTHPAIAVNLDACIQCTRCVRACREEQVHGVIGLGYRGQHSKIVFDMDDPMGLSTCVGCGECVEACPTGALMPANQVALKVPDKVVDSVCPYCGVGCLLSYHVKDNKVLHVSGRDGPSNHGRLCVKGRYGFDYTHHPERLTKPLIRRKDRPKTTELIAPAAVGEYFREATWEEALDYAAAGLNMLKATHGNSTLAAFGSAKGSNEEAYLVQKMVRTGFGNNNIDHCTRLCHASSVAALLEGIGSGAVSNQVADGVEADVMIIIGSCITENHPVAATFVKNAVRRAKSQLIVIEPRRSDIAEHARHFLQIRPASDVILLNSMMHTIITEKLHNQSFIDERTTGFAELKKTVMQYSPEQAALVCGIPPETIRAAARLYAKAERAIIFWGMGISQHIHGTDNARCLISLALLTGHIGRPGTGLHPLRGQNNVQGASDMGLIPMYYPDYQSVENDKAQQIFEKAWKTKLNPEKGLTVIEIMGAIHAGNILGMYIMGENPAMSDPNLKHARAALAKLEHLIVQDIFFTETCSYADVILPASTFLEKTGTVTNTDRRVQLGQQALLPPGDARQDLWIIQELAKRIGLDWYYVDAADVFEEIRHAVPSMAGITWQRLQSTHSLTYPLVHEEDPGEAVLFEKDFPTKNGKARFVPAKYSHADELPDSEYPYILITSRLLEHWHTGSMTRRSRVLDAIEPLPTISIHPEDLAQIGGADGEMLKLASRRGEIVAKARADSGVQRQVIIIPFAFREAAANLLTNQAIDPVGKIPEFKFCAAQLSVA